LDTGIILESYEKYICLKQIQGKFYAKDSHYDVKAELGKGGLGTVYKCVDKNSCMDFVIKRVILSDNPMHIKSLVREVNTLLVFKHPRVIKIYGIIQRREGVIDVLLEPWGESLNAYLTNLKRIPQKTYPNTSDICWWFYQIIYVLKDFHLKGLVHCDIHFGNILILDGQIKLCDLGSAKKKGEILGTPSHGISPMYFPPTVLRNYLKCQEKPSQQPMDYLVSERLDTFAVGKLLLELINHFNGNDKYITIEQMRPYIYDRTRWDRVVEATIPENTRTGIKQTIIGLMSFKSKDSIQTDKALEILFIETRL
jgi:serine/threonine protein kinase